MHKSHIWYCPYYAITITVTVSTYKDTCADTENANVSLTGWASARLRRHPSTNTSFSMVTVIRPVERKITDLIRWTVFPKYQQSHPLTNLTWKKKSEDSITFRSSELQQTVLQMIEGLLCFSECWTFPLYSFRIWCHLISIMHCWEIANIMKSSTSKA